MVLEFSVTLITAYVSIYLRRKMPNHHLMKINRKEQNSKKEKASLFVLRIIGFFGSLVNCILMFFIFNRY